MTEVGRGAAAFHNGPLLIMCVAISIFVLVLLGYTMVKFRRGANPVPSRTSHNTLIEVIWTVVPVLILVAIAIPSIRLISKQYSPPPADVTSTGTGPIGPGGVTAVIVLALTTTTFVAAAPLNVTLAGATKFEPMIVTAVPPVIGPLSGVMLLIDGPAT